MHEYEAKFLIKINYAISFNTTPILTISFNQNIVDEEYSCQLFYNP